MKALSSSEASQIARHSLGNVSGSFASQQKDFPSSLSSKITERQEKNSELAHYLKQAQPKKAKRKKKLKRSFFVRYTFQTISKHSPLAIRYRVVRVKMYEREVTNFFQLLCPCPVMMRFSVGDMEFAVYSEHVWAMFFSYSVSLVVSGSIPKSITQELGIPKEKMPASTARSKSSLSYI